MAGVITMSYHIVSSVGVSLHAKEVNMLNPSNGSMTSLIIFAIKLWLLLKKRLRSFITVLILLIKIKDHYQQGTALGFD